MLSALAWSPSAGLPSARGGVVAAQDAVGATVVLGGATTDVPSFVASNPSWETTVTAANPLDSPLSAPGVGSLAGGGILLFGGKSDVAESAAISYDYNIDGNSLNEASLHTARYAMGDATDENLHIYAIGGHGGSNTIFSSVESYDPGSNKWTVEAPLPAALYSLSAVGDGAGHLFAFGGIASGGSTSAAVYRYTIATNTWDTVASLPTATSGSAAILGSDSKIYVLGGVTAGGTTVAVESYSETTNSWTAETALPAPVSGEAVSLDALGRIVIAGGFDATGAPTAAVYVSQQLNQPDAAPVITSTAPTIAYPGQAYSYQVFSTGNPQPTYSLLSAPAGMVVNAVTGLIAWTPTAAQAGNQSVTVQAANSLGTTLSTFSVSVTLSPPVIYGSAVPTAVANLPFSYTFSTAGTPAPTLSFVSAPAGMTITATSGNIFTPYSQGVVNWTPTYAQESSGGNSFVVQASNGSGTVTRTFSVKVAPQAPTGLTAIGTSTSTVGLSWSGSPDPSVVSYKVYKQGFIHSPRGSGGSYTYTLVATSTTNSATVGASGTYLVSAVNSVGVESARSNAASASVWTPASFPQSPFYLLSGGALWGGPLAVTVGQTVQISLIGAGNPAPTYSVVSGPPTVSIDPNTAVITYTPGINEIGLVNVTFQASNAAGSATQTIQFQVGTGLIVDLNTSTPYYTNPVAWSTPAWHGELAGGVGIASSGASIGDAVSSTLASMTVTLSGANTTSGDFLIGSGNNNITAGHYLPSTGQLIFSGTDTLANYLSALKSVVYNNASTLSGPGKPSQTITVAANDGLATSNTATATITISQAPVVRLNVNTINYSTLWQNAGAVPISGFGPTAGAGGFAAPIVADAEAANLQSMTVTIANPQAGDVLSATASGGVSVSAYNATTGQLVLSGNAPLSDYQSVLGTVQYNNTSGGPGVSVVTVTVTDTDGLLTSNTATATVNISTGGPVPSIVAGTYLFYDHSAYNNNTVGISPIASRDNTAIDPLKTPYLGGTSAASANLSGFTGGINGVMFDLTPSASAAHGSITASDLTLRVSGSTFNSAIWNTPSAWASAPAPSSLSVRAGGGAGGSDRVEITWSDGAIKNQWLEVTVAADSNTGLSAPYTFFFGNLVGDSGDSNTSANAIVGSADELDAQLFTGAGPNPVYTFYDFNKSKAVDANDLLAARGNPGSLRWIDVLPSAFAPIAGSAVFAPSIADSPTSSSSDIVTSALAAAALPASASVPSASVPMASLAPSAAFDEAVRARVFAAWGEPSQLALSTLDGLPDDESAADDVLLDSLFDDGL